MLNIFQRVMIQWTELHPYNAVHVYRLAGQLNLDRLKQAIRDTYQFNGLGLVEILPARGQVHHESTDSVEIEVFNEGEEAAAQLARHVTSELNRPFPRLSRYQPIRFRVVTAVTEGDAAYYLLVAYDHWFADSAGIRLIMRHVLGRYCNLEIPENNRPLCLYPETYRGAFRRHFRPWKLAKAAVRSACNIARNRSAALMPYSSIEQMAVGFELFDTAPDALERLHHFARSQGATIHDVILAIISRAAARCLPRRSLRKGGRKLVTGTIVDTRSDTDLDLQESLGTFLAYYQVPCRPDKHEDIASLTRSIAAVTRSLKRRRQYLDSVLNMQFIHRLWPRLTPAAKPRYLRRAIPMIGGVSNIRLRDPWVEQCVGNHPFGYVRAAPTGPMLPFVLTPTTLKDRMNLGITYRLTAFSQAKLAMLVESILDDLQQPDGSPATRKNHIMHRTSI